MESILVTGGCGFIGSNFIRHVLSVDSEVSITNLDLLTYAGNLENLSDLETEPRYRFVHGNIGDADKVEALFEEEGFDGVVNFAAESHVDRSILGPRVFTETNVTGTQVLMDAARKAWEDDTSGRLFLQVSTDEVYGSLGPEGKFHETTPLKPNSPYSASKAAADLLCRSYFKTFGFPVAISRCSNNYGPFQFPEKLIPLMILNALRDEALPVYGDGKNVRDWIHVLDHARALHAILERGTPGEIYNIGADTERENIWIVRTLLDILEKPHDLITFVKDRPGHDRRYAIDSTKIETELGWKPQVPFEKGLRETVDWYLTHRGWWERILSGEYQSYYEKQYGSR